MGRFALAMWLMFFMQTHLRAGRTFDGSQLRPTLSAVPIRLACRVTICLHSTIGACQGLICFHDANNRSGHIYDNSISVILYAYAKRDIEKGDSGFLAINVLSYLNLSSLAASKLAAPPRTASHATRSSARKFLNFQLRCKHCAAQPPLDSYRPPSIPKLHPPIDPPNGRAKRTSPTNPARRCPSD